ncbi:hypothetical protein ACVXG9_11005 [Escherichia coli]
MKLSGREIAIVFHFAGDFFLYVEIFTATSISADAMPLLSRDSVRASDNNFDKHYHLARFYHPLREKKYIYLH